MSILLITPPFTQLNTPYPATAYLKGFLNTQKIPSFQADMGLDVILALFNSRQLSLMFSSIKNIAQYSENAQKIYALRDQYTKTIDTVINFLQGKNLNTAYNITKYNFLPQASRFNELADLEFHFGTLGIVDKAKYIATMYLEDIGDFITECIDENFGFSRYAERLSRSANTFDELYQAVHNNHTLIDDIIVAQTQELLVQHQPKLVAISIPFPGNLYAGLKIAYTCKQQHPDIKIVMGGGYVNTELRNIKDKRIFEWIDYLTLDDGERPIELLYKHITEHYPFELLKRTFALSNDAIAFYNGDIAGDYKQEQVGTPDYSDLKLTDYISVIEVANPMHKLWSDGRWNKLTLAHGCYWGKCTFCDISLDYIKNYEATTAQILVDRIETIIAQTGNNAFHFVDEAAPPALMKQLALELLKRNVNITWWTNIRFEKSFTKDLAILLSAAGCIAVSGGLEVASDRLLKLINKGVTVEQVAQVTDHLTSAGILVHAYLMYGFPTQTEQETIDALEYVRQLFENELIQSGFWHQFAMTAHSPIGINPSAFKVKALCNTDAPFANNDIPHKDPEGGNHEKFSYGLKRAIFNYMNGIGIDFPLQDWFDFRIPKTTIKPQTIQKFISQTNNSSPKDHQRVIWLGGDVSISQHQGSFFLNTFTHFGENLQLKFDKIDTNYIYEVLPKLQVQKLNEIFTYGKLKQDYETQTNRSITLLLQHPSFIILREQSLLIV
jgi:radical SAM superfamily enzyme YgiQ (UPF0313 family)